MLRMAERLPQDWEIDYEDLGNGKVERNEYRAFGPPDHFFADVRLAWRDIRTRFGSPRLRSSPAKQQRLGFNRDVTKDPKKSEGEKLREG